MKELESWSKSLMLPYPYLYFEIRKYYQNEPRFNTVYSRNNFSKIKDGSYLINLEVHESIGAPENVTCFDSFGVEHIPKEIRKFIGNTNVITNVYMIQNCVYTLLFQIY